MEPEGETDLCGYSVVLAVRGDPATIAQLGVPSVESCSLAIPAPIGGEIAPHDPTCVIDIDGLNSVNTHFLMESVRQAFDDAGLPYAQHWGKFHDLQHGRLERSYGPDLAAFQQAREQLLPTPQDRRVFSLSAHETVIGL